MLGSLSYSIKGAFWLQKFKKKKKNLTFYEDATLSEYKQQNHTLMYITEFNFRRMIRQIDETQLESNRAEFLRDISFLTKVELKELQLIHLISENPQILSDNAFQFVNIEDEFLNGKTPAYHLDQNCGRLHSDFRGIKIPQELINTGRTAEVREWFKENAYLLKSEKLDVLEMRFRNRFQCSLDVKNLENSGSIVFYNDSIEELEQLIKDTLDRANNFGESASEQRIVNAFGKIHYITKREDFRSKHYDTNQVKEVVVRFNKEIRYPLIELLRKYFIAKYNSRLEFSQGVLDQLGFVPCRCCRVNS